MEQNNSAQSNAQPTHNNQAEQNSGDSCLKSAFVALLIIAAIILVVYLAVKAGNGDSGGLLSREAKNSDITITQRSDFSLTTNFDVIPYNDVENLQIKINFLDSKKQTITTRTQRLGNVRKGVKYNLSFDLSSLGRNIFELEYWSYEVTGGTVPGQ